MQKKYLIGCLFFLILCSFATAADISGTYPDLEKVGETEILTLYFNFEQPAIIVQDKRNGFLWKSFVSADEYDLESLNKKWRSILRSLFTFNYYAVSKVQQKAVVDKSNPFWDRHYLAGFFLPVFTDARSFTSAELAKHELEVTRIENGVRVKYLFVNYGINISVDLYIRHDTLHVDLPIKAIEEIKNFAVADLELLPFFGAASGDEDGYMFYPDGSGALSYLRRDKPPVIERYIWPIFGSADVDLDKYELTSERGIKQVMLPVFGMKRGENAFAAFVTEGQYDTTINLRPVGDVVNLNRIHPEFIYRRVHEYIHFTTDKSTAFSDELVAGDRAVQYVFLEGENADYSGMAETYRGYLLESGKMKSVVEAGDPIPLWMDLLMGVQEKRILSDKFIAATTFEQAEGILGMLTEQGVDTSKLNLIGWDKNGFGRSPMSLPPNKRLGGNSGIKSLINYATDNGASVYLQGNFVDAVPEGGNFSERRHMAQHKSGMVVTNRLQDRFIFNPVISFERYIERFLPKVRTYDIDGLSFDKMGSLVYFDYHYVNEVQREETAGYWRQFLDESLQRFGSSVVRGGNEYLLGFADWLLDIPDADSGYYIRDEVVPFYQMVVHGHLPYATVPGNLSYNHTIQKLKWIEFGSMPYYYLTYESPDLLTYTEANTLFSSEYAIWIETAADVYEEFNKKLYDTWDREMVEHERLRKGVVRVVYANGTTVYVNYNDVAEQADEYTVAPFDYLVVDSTGNVR